MVISKREMKVIGKTILENGREKIVSEDAMLNNRLLNKTPLKRDQELIPYYKIDPTGDRILATKMSETSLLRLCGFVPVVEPKTFRVVLGNGMEKDLLVDNTYMMDPHKTVIYVAFVKDPGQFCEDEALISAFERSQGFIMHGLVMEGLRYEYLKMSASQKAGAKAVFVRTDYRVPVSIIAKMKEMGNDEYARWLAGLTGAMAMLELSSYGAFSMLNGKMGNPSKIMSRIGADGSSSKVLCRGARIRILESIRMEWSDRLAAMRLEALMKDGIPQAKAEELVRVEAGKWKAEKWDGQSIVRASFIGRSLRVKGIRIKDEDLVGQLLQDRYGISKKGTLVVLSDEMMDNLKFPDESYAYRDFDIIVEGASWKQDYNNQVYRDDLAPEFCLLAMSKLKASNSLHYMLELALDGTDGNANTVFHTLKEIADEEFSRLRSMMYDGSLAMAGNGVMGWSQHIDDDGLDEKRSHMTPVLGAIEAYNNSVYDLSVRKKLLSKVFPTVRDIWNGHLPIEGSTRFMITDPSAFFRTDLAVPVEGPDGEQATDMYGNPLWRIVIENPDDLVLDDTKSAYWDGREKEALLFRSPCVHPGEPQIVNLVQVEDMWLDLSEQYGEDFAPINLAELYRKMDKLLVINACSSILEALGGAKSYWLPLR